MKQVRQDLKHLESKILLSRADYHNLILEEYEKSFDNRNLTQEYKKFEIKNLNIVFAKVLINNLEIPTIIRHSDTFDLLAPLNQAKIVDNVRKYINSESQKRV